MNIRTSALLVLLSAAGTAAFVPTAANARFTALNAEKKKIFIDGEAGTTGLQVRGRIEARDDLEIISAPDELRKDEATRKALINEADAVILCKSIQHTAILVHWLPTYEIIILLLPVIRL